MSYIFLWSSHWIFSLLLVATVLALASRCQKPRWRRFWPILTAILLFLPFLATTVVGALLVAQKVQPKWLFGYGLSQVMVYLILVVIILRRGLKGFSTAEQWGSHWPRVRLLIASLLVLMIYVGTLNFIELRGRVELANLHSDTTAKIISILPANLPDAFNAHSAYDQAARALGPRQELPEWFRQETSNPYFEPASEPVTSFLAKQRGTLVKVRRAASMPGYSLAVDVSNPHSWLLPSYSGYLDLARLLSLSARTEASSGNLTAALQDLAVIESMSGHLRSFPMLFSFIVSSAVEQIRVQGLEYVLATSPRMEPGLIDLPVTPHPSLVANFLKAQQMEAYSIMQTLATVLTGDDFFIQGGFVPEFGRTGEAILAKLWRVFLIPSELKMTGEILVYRMTKSEESYEEILNNWKAVDEALAAGEMGLIAAIAIPNLSTYVVRAMRYEALTRLSDLALAAAAFKAATGSYPASQDDLVPGYLDRIAIDPFDHKPLKLSAVAGGLELLSVGTDSLSLPTTSRGPIHFYLGKAPYDEYRLKPAQEENRQKQSQQGKKRKRK